MAVLQTIRVGAKHQISMIRVPGATLVVGLTEKGIQTLAELPELAREESTASIHSTLQAVASNDSLSSRVEEDDSNPFLDRVLGNQPGNTGIHVGIPAQRRLYRFGSPERSCASLSSTDRRSNGYDEEGSAEAANRRG